MPSIKQKGMNYIQLLIFLMVLWAIACYESEIPIPGDSPESIGWSRVGKLTPGNRQVNDNFGHGVSISGDFAIVSAAGTGETGLDPGAAYIYYRDGDTWTEHQKLIPVDGAADDHFGSSVDISGNYAIVGAVNNGSGSGAVYIYYWNGNSWTTEHQKLTPVDGTADDHFGCGVSIAGNYAVVGACHDDDEENSKIDSGAAYIYCRTGSSWKMQQKLIPPDIENDDAFGHSVGISIMNNNPCIIIGAPYHKNGKGKVYVFVWTGAKWIKWANLTATELEEGDHFGYYVDIYKSYAIVSAASDHANNIDSGSAYIYYNKDSVWTLQKKISARNGIAAVSISPDYAVMGCQYDSTGTGSVCIYRRTGKEWTEQQHFIEIDCAAGDWFGCSVGISLDHIFVGVFRDDLEDSGSVYIYKEILSYFQGTAELPLNR